MILAALAILGIVFANKMGWKVTAVVFVSFYLAPLGIMLAYLHWLKIRQGSQQLPLLEPSASTSSEEQPLIASTNKFFRANPACSSLCCILIVILYLAFSFGYNIWIAQQSHHGPLGEPGSGPSVQ